MSITSYATVNGILVGESGPNGIVNYHTDALGSVTMTSDQNGSIQNQYRYSPAGAQNYFDGSYQVPQFLWVGSLGYRHTGRIHSNTYLRARHYSSDDASWSSWVAAGLSGYLFARQNPLNHVPRLGSCDLSVPPSAPGYFINGISMPPAPSTGNCGAWGDPSPYKIRWDIKSLRKLTNADGWIIQEIDNLPVSMPSCMPPNPPCTRDEIHYWEGWYLTGNNVEAFKTFTVISPPHDIFTDPFECDCNSGSKTRLAWAKFYPSDKDCWQAWNWAPGDHVSGRIDLLGGGKPTGWDRSNAFHRTVTAIASCCLRINLPCFNHVVCDQLPTTFT
jgi:hypothetical protein